MIHHVIFHSNNLIQSNRTPWGHPQGPVWGWPQMFYDIVDHSPFILYCEEQPVIFESSIPQPLAGENWYSVSSLKHLQC